MQHWPGWQGFRIVVAQLTIGEMASITGMAATISSVLSYAFKTVLTADIQKDMEAKFILRSEAKKERELLELQIAQHHREYERLVVQLKEAIHKADATKIHLTRLEALYFPNRHGGE
jgi:hypothetical protein